MLANREFELKLALSQEDFDHLSANQTLLEHRDDRTEKTLKSVYYDTPDFRLRDLGVSLRVRDDGNGFVQTVKAETRIESGISNPIQIEAPVTGPEPDLERISDKGIRRKLSDAVSGSPLTQAFETVVTRTSYKLGQGDSVIELALDRGEARANGRQTEIREAELELVKGDPKVLLGVAQDLFSGQAVHVSPVSKAERGYRLLLKIPEARPEVSPAKAKQVEIKSCQSCGAAFAEIFAQRASKSSPTEPSCLKQI